MSPARSLMFEWFRNSVCCTVCVPLLKLDSVGGDVT